MISREKAALVVSVLSEMIMDVSVRLAREESAPCSNPDTSDEIIKTGRNTLERLRVMRLEIEILTSGVLPD